MSRLNLVVPERATDAQRALLEEVRRQQGGVARPVQVLANAPAVARAFLGLHAALGQGTLAPRLRELLAVAVSAANGCAYCVAFHARLGARAGLAEAELEGASRGEATDARERAALHFALAVNARRGAVTDAELAEARAAGYTDAELLELLAAVAATHFGNLLNRLADTGLDLPRPAWAPAPGHAA